jgi:hypothetical protein
VSPDHAVRNLICLQQPDQIWPGHIQEVSSLLRSQFSRIGMSCTPCPLASSARI